MSEQSRRWVERGALRRWEQLVSADLVLGDGGGGVRGRVGCVRPLLCCAEARRSARGQASELH